MKFSVGCQSTQLVAGGSGALGGAGGGLAQPVDSTYPAFAGGKGGNGGRGRGPVTVTTG